MRQILRRTVTLAMLWARVHEYEVLGFYMLMQEIIDISRMN